MLQFSSQVTAFLRNLLHPNTGLLYPED